MTNRLDLTGQTFGRLVATKYVGKSRCGSTLWECKCSCGNVTVVTLSNLRNGHTKSCGCLNIERATERRITHNMTGTRFYNVYHKMVDRCNNENEPAYPRYGGRGIKCLWSTFEEFKDDMYESYLDHIEKHGDKNTSIDRIDNDGNYCKENCRWATKEEQGNNKRNNRIVIIDGEQLTAKQASERYNINYHTVHTRLRRGKDIFGNEVIL